MPLRIRLADDLGPDGMEPLIAVSVIEVPVRVYEVSDRLATQLQERFCQSRSRDGDASFYENFSILAAKDRDVSARTLQDAYVIPKLV